MAVIPVVDKVALGWLNKTGMAASLGISVQAFDKWRVEPVGRVGRSVYFTAYDVMQNRKQNEASKQQPKHEEEDLSEGLEFERYRLTKAQADNMEIKNEIAKGQTAPIEIIQLVLSRISGEAAAELDSIPLNLKRKHPDISNQLIEDVKRHCVKAQNAIAECGEVLDGVLDDYLSDSDAA